MMGNDKAHEPHRTGTDRPTERKLDDSIEDTFPASDPPSVTRAPPEKSETKIPPPGTADRKTPEPTGRGD
jgi:hypothetical protein